MRTHRFIATAVLVALVAAAPLASAQNRQRSPSRGGDGGGNGSGGGRATQGDRSSGQRSAVPRDGGGGRVQQPPRENGRTEQRADGGRTEAAPPPQPRRQPQASTSGGNDGRRGEVRQEGRTGASNNGRYDGTGRYAVPRKGPVPYYRDGDRRVYVQPRQNYYVYRYPAYRYGYPGYYYGYPNSYYGYRYYDPYFVGNFYWTNHAWQPVPYYYGTSVDYDLGKLRIDIQPREAEVYIDGNYAGVVDDFDGRLQGLRLEAGNYSVEVALPGFVPLRFDVHVQAGRTTTYRGSLVPEQQQPPPTQ